METTIWGLGLRVTVFEPGTGKHKTFSSDKRRQHHLKEEKKKRQQGFTGMHGDFCRIRGTILGVLRSIVFWVLRLKGL